MRKPENIKEEQNASTLDKYLIDVIKDVKTEVEKSDIEQDKKDCILKCLPAIRNYGLHADARDGVLEFLESILGKTLDLHGKECFNKMYNLFGEYEFFDAHEGEAYKCRSRVKQILLKYNLHSSHSQSEVSHFQEGMEGFC